jgi:hypothetical protein
MVRVTTTDRRTALRAGAGLVAGGALAAGCATTGSAAPPAAPARAPAAKATPLNAPAPRAFPQQPAQITHGPRDHPRDRAHLPRPGRPRDRHRPPRRGRETRRPGHRPRRRDLARHPPRDGPPHPRRRPRPRQPHPATSTSTPCPRPTPLAEITGCADRLKRSPARSAPGSGPRAPRPRPRSSSAWPTACRLPARAVVRRRLPRLHLARRPRRHPQGLAEVRNGSS